MTDQAVIHIVAGPTASGKSSFALELAAKHNGVIINCDSLQVYNELPILTAQPSAEDIKAAPHRLYSALHPNNPCSAGNWREMVIPVIDEVLAEKKTPIICGGTGLYIRALIEGLSPIPDIPMDIRNRINALQKELGNPAFHLELQKIDPIMAERLGPYNTARLIRAYEVMEATGKSLAHWQALPLETPPDHWHFEIHKIMPDRETRRDRCDLRFNWMMDNGVLEEVAAFDEKLKSGEVNEGTPITKALGFEPLRAYLNGTMSKEDAIERGKLDTKYYAKRQATWFRHQL